MNRRPRVTLEELQRSTAQEGGCVTDRTIREMKRFKSNLFSGNYQLIFPFEPILAAPGDDVILPCRVDPYWNAMEKTVEWSRPDLKASDPQKRVEYVYVHRFRKMDRDMMMETYIQRTSLSEGLRHGDVSLRIHNVSLEDNGRFRCFIPSLSREDGGVVQTNY
ncbi:PREDICTED: myelin-oligodendrocyte glycoprotein-like [Cyprinodon variegatus]|uniref:myelin-oligodendrocyte glycoprotein-like n=1 Tax=Cyprinodon variegatus TaxID=28743 RepID=UPI0007427B8C|nr:PREDICTED: myelin-oligodendrocyte glycoprotein-like [Cyprinodon variegatus]